MCRPEDNRTPSTTEIKNCRDRLFKTIYAIDPRIILAAGKTAASAIVGKKVAITNRRGDIFDVEIPSPVTGGMIRYPMMAIYHPSFLLRKGDGKLINKKKGETYKTLGDLRYALSLLSNYDTIAGR